MALRQLLVNKKIKERKSLLDQLRSAFSDLKKRESDLEAAIGEAATDEEIKAVEEEVEELQKEIDEKKEEEKELVAEIEDLETELKELEEKEPEDDKGNGDVRSMAKTVQTRTQELGDNYLTREVLDFYTELRSKLKSRAAGNVLPAGGDNEIIVPDLVMSRIRERIGDFTTLYPLVDLVVAKGRVKLILDVDTKEATWMEMRGVTLPEDDDSELSAVEFDGFLIGRIVYIDNSLLDDAQPILNLDDYLTKRIARSIAKGIDKAIAVGEGKEKKQPAGIIPAIPTENQVTAKPAYAEIIPHIGKIDTGEDATGDITVAMHRQTYYERIAALTLHVDSGGKDVVQLPNLSTPNFLGLPVVFNNYIPKDKLIFGVFEKYTLVEREETKIDSSQHYKFRDYQTAIRGIGRYDGKPVEPAAFVQVTLEIESEVPGA
ncbi:phage major capsid protein [Enterococcus termitis]|uniref:Capsid protein n=1 Tax=Enterococcus termitis TaxID=332950 RepID=A0A1E5GU15_9ENTE|nr:phage major capsid protein [Enterococcus termitis]OEG16171.1 capsid protein [Enterococcus termitis]